MVVLIHSNAMQLSAISRRKALQRPPTTLDFNKCLESLGVNKWDPMMVLGVTENCYLYYGQVGKHLAVRSAFHLNAPGLGGSKACQKKKAFLVRSYGEAQNLVILVDRYGRRVRVQPALSKSTVLRSDITNGTAWQYVNPTDRLSQFYSDVVHIGFTIIGFHYYKYRVLVYAVSHFAVRLYELRLHIGNYYITPYLYLLRQLERSIASPDKNLKIWPRRGIADSDSVALDYGGGLAFSIPLKDLIMGDSSKLRLLNRTQLKEYDPLSENTAAARICDAVGPPLFFNITVQRADYWLLDVTIRRWVNPLNAHRRMSYPHAIKRMEHHEFFRKGWAKALPIVASNIIILLIGTLVFVRLVSYYNREYRRRRFSLEGSISMATN